VTPPSARPAPARASTRSPRLALAADAVGAKPRALAPRRGAVSGVTAAQLLTAEQLAAAGRSRRATCTDAPATIGPGRQARAVLPLSARRDRALRARRAGRGHQGGVARPTRSKARRRARGVARRSGTSASQLRLETGNLDCNERLRPGAPEPWRSRSGKKLCPNCAPWCGSRLGPSARKARICGPFLESGRQDLNLRPPGPQLSRGQPDASGLRPLRPLRPRAGRHRALKGANSRVAVQAASR
jgi:hypothetical protein